MVNVLVQSAPFEAGAALDAFCKEAQGAVISFTGIVRGDGISALEIEHYPQMAEKSLAEILKEAHAKWALQDAMVRHRFGRMLPGETIMMTAVAAPHRSAAFDAASYIMDHLKTRAPFWKKEISKDGATWLAPRVADLNAIARW